MEQIREPLKSGNAEDTEIRYRQAVRTALALSYKKASQLHAEPYLLKALSYDRHDEIREELTFELAKIFKMKGNLNGAIELFKHLLQVHFCCG